MILARWWPEEEGIAAERMVARWSSINLYWDADESDQTLEDDYFLESVMSRCREEGLKISIQIGYYGDSYGRYS